MPPHTPLPAPVRHGCPSPPAESWDTGHNLGRLTVDVDGQRFRVRPAQLSTQWLPDTPSNRPLTVVWLRRRRDAHDQPCLTWQALAPRVGSANRQAARQPLEEFRQGGEDCHAFVLRKRKGDATVVAAVWAALRQTPFAGPTEWLARVQKRLGRHDLDAANIESALEHISCVPVLRTLRRQLEAGQVHDQEAWRWTECLEPRSLPAPPPAGWSGPSADRGRSSVSPTALAALVPPYRSLAPVSGSPCWLTFLLTLFYWHVPRSV